MTIIEKLLTLRACDDTEGKGVQWVRAQANGKLPSAQKLWDSCPNGDDMLWLLQRTEANTLENKVKFVRIHCAIAQMRIDTAKALLKNVPATEKRPAIAIKTAEKCQFAILAWCDNPNDQTKDAARAAGDAAWDAARAAWAAAGAAWAAARAAAGAAAWDARDAVNRQIADIVRLHFPKAPKLPVKSKQ